MGCSVSSERSGEAEVPTRPVMERPIDVAWKRDDEWGDLFTLFLQTIAEGDPTGEEVAERSQQADFHLDAVRDWVYRKYPDCARASSIHGGEDNTEMSVPTKEGLRDWPYRFITIHEPNNTGILLAVVLAIAVPLREGETFPGTGAMLDGPEMGRAKESLTKMMPQLESQGTDLTHTELQVFMGADMVRAWCRPGTKEPTFKRFEHDPNDAFRKANKRLSKALTSPGEAMPMLLPGMFEGSIRQMQARTPGCTVWDEGQLSFSISNKPYPHATRLLVARTYIGDDQGVETTSYQVMTPLTDDQAEYPVRISRSADPGKTPGDIVHVVLACALSPDSPWPKLGAFTKRPEMKAAELGLCEILKIWNREGKLHRCVAQVYMGSDISQFCFVGDHYPISPPRTKIEGDIDGFFIRLKEEPKVELFKSEAHFQDIKARMMDVERQDPERSKDRMWSIMVATTRHFLERNFPGSIVTTEGELPPTVDGERSSILQTALVTARDNKKEKNVIAVIYALPRPDGASPLQIPGGQLKPMVHSKEMKDAVAALLQLMRQWYREGKISEEKCMAQVMMGIDADIYHFVDGDRFEDLTEEEMGELKWD